MNRDIIGRPMEVLLVEDSLSFGQVAIAALKRGCLSHRMTWLTDGHSALNFVCRRGLYRLVPRPDLILLDMSLPGLNSHELLSKIRGQTEIAQIPVIIMTAETDDPDIAEQLSHRQLAVQGYLTKPLDVERLIQLVQQLGQFWQADLIMQPF